MAITLARVLGRALASHRLARTVVSIVFTHQHVCLLRDYSPYSQRYATPYLI